MTLAISKELKDTVGKGFHLKLTPMGKTYHLLPNT